MVKITNTGTAPVVLKIYGNKRSETVDSDGSTQQVPDIEMFTLAPGDSLDTDRVPGLVKLYNEAEGGEPWPDSPPAGSE